MTFKQDCPRCGGRMTSPTKFFYCPNDGDVSHYEEARFQLRPADETASFLARMADEARLRLIPMDDEPTLLTVRIR